MREREGERTRKILVVVFGLGSTPNHLQHRQSKLAMYCDDYTIVNLCDLLMIMSIRAF